MYHPLLENLDEKSIEQLTEMLNDLGKKMSIAYQSGNYQMLEQVRMVHAAVQDKFNEKNRLQMQALERRQQDGKDKGSIDIG